MPFNPESPEMEAFYLRGWPCAEQPSVPVEYQADPRTVTDRPGVYAWLLRRELRRDGRPDPRYALSNEPDPPIEPPTPELKALQAGEPVVIRASMVGGNFYGPGNPVGDDATELPLWQRERGGWVIVHPDDRVTAA
jgi:hypothetical protein